MSAPGFYARAQSRGPLLYAGTNRVHWKFLPLSHNGSLQVLQIGMWLRADLQFQFGPNVVVQWIQIR